MTVTTDNKVSAAPRILAVDDEAISREILEKMLTHQGFTVDATSNGKEALALWQQSKHPIIITDCHMPLMNGFELAKSVREIEAQTQSLSCTIIALTANENALDKQHCIAAGMDNMLSKPITQDKLASALNHLSSNTSDIANKAFIVEKQSTIVDYATLYEVFPDKNRQYLMLSALQQHLQVAIIELHQHIENTNILALEAVAHRLKGACKMVGVKQVASVCGDIETQAGLGHLPNQELLNALKSNIAQFNAFMKHQVDDSTFVSKSTTINPANEGK